MDISVKINPVYLPFLDRPQFLQIFFGGSSSGKSYFIAQKIVLDNLNGCNWLCCRNVASTIAKSTFNEVKKAISNMGLWEYYHVNNSNMIITCLLNNKQILFIGLDDEEKVKSITPINGVLERIFIEEATEVKRSAYKQLTKRLRGKTEHSKHVIMAFNPILKSHWIYKEFFGKWEDDKNLYEDQDMLILKTTYKDNLYLTADDVRLLEDESDPYYYSVYSLGNWGILGHVVFQNWHVEDLSNRIHQFDRIYNGMDFGWNDPTAMLKVHLDRNRKKIYVFDEIYQQYMADDELLRASKRFCGNQYVTCDSAEPKTIDFLANNGVRAIGAVKGSDSILRGIRWLQGYEIIVDVRCQNFKNEIEQYHWQEDKFGNVLERPAGGSDHLIDCLRYALNDEILAAEVQAGRRF